jgi:hypothetical protein
MVSMIFHALLLLVAIAVRPVVSFRPQSVLRWEVPRRSNPVISCNIMYSSIEDAELVNEMPHDKNFHSLVSAIESLKNDQKKHHNALISVLKDGKTKQTNDLTGKILSAVDKIEQKISVSYNVDSVNDTGLPRLTRTRPIRTLENLIICAFLVNFFVKNVL